METLITSSPEKDVSIKGIQCDMVKCVTLGVKKGLESENQSEMVGDDMKNINGDENMNPSSTVLSNLSDDRDNTIVDDTAKEEVRAEKMMVFGEVDCKKEAIDGCNATDEDDKVATEIQKRKRGRKKKVPESSEGTKDRILKKVKVEIEEVEVTGRLLRSRTMKMGGGAKAGESRLNESVVGFKRQMEADCFDQPEFLKKVNESSQLARPQKIRKRRGRPPKVLTEAGSRKMKDVSFDQIEVQKLVNEKSQLVGRPQKKQKRRGRPPKKQGEIELKRETKDDCVDQVDLQNEVNKHSQQTGRQQQKSRTKNNKDKMLKKLKGSLSTNTEKPSNNLLKALDVNEGSKIEHVQIKDKKSETTGDNKQKVELSEKNNDHIIAEETAKFDKDRRKKQQVVRDQILIMIMKAGWTIEYRPRQGRDYLDAVYVDQKGRTHWSVTKAYFSLKNKIDKGDADAKEISAFNTIPVEEMNILFRSVSKIRSDKNMKKKKRGKNISQAAIVVSEDSPLMKPVNKKGKAGKKRKEIQNKVSNAKVKKVKSRHEHGVSAESAVKRQSKVNRKSGLIARRSIKGFDQDDEDSAMYTGKRNIFSWMIDSGVMMSGGKLLYKEGRRRNRFLEGQVKCDGIHCSCCNKVMDLSKFVSHGGEKLDHAIENIYYQSGPSLLTCLLESWKKEVGVTNIRFNDVDVKGEDPHDDTCNTCGDGGDLICCDGCPATFHQSCLNIQNFPSGDWHCLYCCCKFCGLVASDDSHHLPSFELITCCLCEEKFHRSCLQEAINADFSSLSFCGSKCQKLYEQLQTYIGVKFELQEGYSWVLLKRYDLSQYFDDPMKVECNSKLAVAFSIMDECFVPIMDERSGVNKIHNVVYNCGSNFKRLDYSGFLTAVLEKEGEFIAAASIRIHGNQLAEMPFIGTRNMYRRQGMCRRLLDAIEGALCSIGVEELVIPAIPELYETWTNAFGFKPLEDNLRQAMKGMSLVVFPFTDMLHKPLLNNQFADKNHTLLAGDKAVEKDDITLISEQTLATHLESVTPSLPSDTGYKLVDLVNNDVTEVKLSNLISKVVPKNSFDLNLQPAATDTDIQSIDDESISRDPQLCKSPFELSESMTQANNTPTQPLVLV